MVSISNSDFEAVKRLLHEIQRITGSDLRAANTRRRAALLVRKFDRKTLKKECQR